MNSVGLMRVGAVMAGMVLGGCAAEPGDRSGAGADAQPPDAEGDAPMIPGEFFADFGPVGDAYYLDTCAHCAGMLGVRGEAHERRYAGRGVRFCSAGCTEAFERDRAGGFERLDRRMIADQLRHYPLSTSIVSGREFGREPVDFIVGNRLFRVSDQAERRAVESDPDSYLRSLDRAVIEAQRPIYGMPTKCPVQGEILEGDTPIDIVVANRMVRVCCANCVRRVRSRPSQYLGMVDFSNREAAAARAGEQP